MSFLAQIQKNMTLNNVAGKVFEVGGTLGIKGFLSLGCLCVGISGLIVGVKSSYKIDSMVEAFKKIENAEMDDDIKSLVQDHIISQADRYEKSIAELQSYIKDIETDNVESISKELNIINQKIDAFNLTTVIEKWSDAHLSEQADQGETAGEGIRKLIEFVRDTQSNYQDVEQKFNSIKAQISRKLDSFLQDIEDIKNKQSEILEEIQNNQAELVDINSQTFDILQILKNRNRSWEIKQQLSNNLVEIEINNTKKADTISGFNNAVDFEFITHGTVKADSFKAEGMEGETIGNTESFHYVVETGEISREANQFSGFAYSTDVNYDNSSFELNYFSGSGEINGSLEGLTVEED